MKLLKKLYFSYKIINDNIVIDIIIRNAAHMKKKQITNGGIGIREKRIWYSNARYHLMARSVRSLALFRNEEDYEVFFALLKKTREKYPFVIHSYCLMTTHFHILVSTINHEIWKIMKYLMQNYAMYFNRKYQTRGHVFDYFPPHTRDFSRE